MSTSHDELDERVQLAMANAAMTSLLRGDPIEDEAFVEELDKHIGATSAMLRASDADILQELEEPESPLVFATKGNIIYFDFKAHFDSPSPFGQ